MYLMDIRKSIKGVLAVIFIGLAFFVLMMGKVYAQTNYPKPMAVVYTPTIK